MKKSSKIRAKNNSCRCNKSKCLKLYCECFSNQKMCSESCQCKNCFNVNEFKTLKELAILDLLEQNPFAFESKFKEVELNGAKIHRRGCACKNSKCMKNYCECHQAQIKCSNICRCKNCENIDFSLKIEQLKPHQIIVKRKRKKKDNIYDNILPKFRKIKRIAKLIVENKRNILNDK